MMNWRWLWLVIVLLSAAVASADMYPDASNADIPIARTNLNASPSINIKDYGAKADAKFYGTSQGTCSIGSGTNNLNCPIPMFTEADVGKRIVVDYAGVGRSALQTTVATYVSPTNVLLTDPASVSVPYYKSSPLVRLPSLPMASNTVGVVKGYKPGDTVTFAGGTFTTPTIVSLYGLQPWAAAIVNGGTGGSLGGTVTTGDCTVRGTTGGTVEGSARAVLRVTLTNGTITSIHSWSNRGFYKVNPTNPAAEPVIANVSGQTPADEDDESYYNRVPACTGITGAVMAFDMGPALQELVEAGVYSVAPTSPVAQASTTGTGTGATFVTFFTRAGATAVYTDSYDAFVQAINAHNAEITAGRRACILIPVGLYGLRGVPGTPLPRLNGPGCVKGESAVGSRVFIDPGYSGDVFAETDSYLVSLLQEGGIEPLNTMRHGSEYSDFSIVGDRLSPNIQNAMKFYNRTDHAYINNVTVSSIPGNCLSFGTPTVTGGVPFTQAWPRETNVAGLNCLRTGKGDIPSVDFGASGVGGSGTHRIDSLNIYGSEGSGLVIRNGVRGVKIGILRIEGRPSETHTHDLFQIGDPADTRNTSAILVGLVSLVDVPPGAAGLGINCNTTGQRPFGIHVERFYVGGGSNWGKGLHIRCGNGLSFGVASMQTRDTQIEVAPAPSTGPPIEIRGSGGELGFNYGGEGVPNLSMPIRASSAPGSLIPIGITLPYVVPNCQSGIPVTVRSATEVLAASCDLPTLKKTDRIEVETHWAWPSSANVKTPRVRLHTQQNTGGAAKFMEFAATTSLGARCITKIANAGDASAQVGSGNGCVESIANTTGAITSGIGTGFTAYINITAQGDAAGVAAAEDITLLSWSVKIIPGS